MKRAALFYWLVGIVLVVICIVAAFHFDAAVAQFMKAQQTPGMRNLMRNVSRFGDWWPHCLVKFALKKMAAGR